MVALNDNKLLDFNKKLNTNYIENNAWCAEIPDLFRVLSFIDPQRGGFGGILPEVMMILPEGL
jgi:hypothetical protein